MNDHEKAGDLDEAAQLEEAAQALTGAVRDEVLKEAAALRSKWQAPDDMVHLASVSADLRESDLAEATRLEAVACTLRTGAGRRAVEAEAAALRAKWPDFSDDAEGQVLRLGAYLLAHGAVAGEDFVPARYAVDRLLQLEAQVAALGASAAGRACHACGIPQQAGAGQAPVNAFALAAIRAVETDAQFREQVKSGQVLPGQATHPWLPAAPPHKGPAPGTSPWALASLATMVRGDERLVAEVGPKLRAAFAERSLSVPVPHKSGSASASMATRPN